MKKFVVDFNNMSDDINPKVLGAEVEMTAEEITTRQAEEAEDGTDAERAMRALRVERDKKLAETDWTQGADVPSSIKNSYVTYRQALRDITNTYNNPRTVVWPTKP
tara:strand:- start:484 stop:801 length:318 start_codon:yes stop_codon:yes gene_type:complete